MPTAARCAAFAPYDIANVKVVGYDVVANRPKLAAYRAPGAPMAAFAVESVLDELAEKLGMDPLELRLKNAAQRGHQGRLRPDLRPRSAYVETLEAAKAHPH